MYDNDHVQCMYPNTCASIALSPRSRDIANVLLQTKGTFAMTNMLSLIILYTASIRETQWPNDLYWLKLLWESVLFNHAQTWRSGWMDNKGSKV